VRRQKKSAHYSSIQSGKYRRVCSQSSLLDNELAKERTLMNRLIDIVSKLKQEFPEARSMLDHVVCGYGHTCTALEVCG